MAFKTIIARYPGVCKRCGGSIEAGQRMRYGGRSLTYHLASDCGGSEPNEERYMDDPEYHRERLMGHFDYQDERGVWHLE